MTPGQIFTFDLPTRVLVRLGPAADATSVLASSPRVEIQDDLLGLGVTTREEGDPVLDLMTPGAVLALEIHPTETDDGHWADSHWALSVDVEQWTPRTAAGVVTAGYRLRVRTGPVLTRKEA